MNAAQLSAVKDHFFSYSDGYIRRSGPMVRMMELKREHCAEVAANCRTLAEAMNWPYEDVNTAEALGFLHDVGRFPQLEEYGTFMDSKSIDHGERGYQAILESDLLRELEPEHRDGILNGVRYHNKKTVPEGLPEDNYPFLRLIRDADRLDIYRVVYEAIKTDTIAEHPEIGLGLSLEGAPSKAVLDAVALRKPANYTDLKCFADFVLLIISWAYQMNNPAALKIMRERNVVDGLSATLPMNDPAVAQFVSGIKMFMGDSNHYF